MIVKFILLLNSTLNSNIKCIGSHLLFSMISCLQKLLFPYNTLLIFHPIFSLFHLLIYIWLFPSSFILTLNRPITILIWQPKFSSSIMPLSSSLSSSTSPFPLSFNLVQCSFELTNTVSTMTKHVIWWSQERP